MGSASASSTQINYISLGGTLIAKQFGKSTFTTDTGARMAEGTLGFNPFANPYEGATPGQADGTHGNAGGNGGGNGNGNNGNGNGNGGNTVLATTAVVNPETYSVEYVHTDALGSPVAYTGSNGSVLPGRSMRYEPYGTPTMAARDGEPSYIGHQYDASTGLIYAQQRYYDPMLGRFLGVDPMAVDTGSAFNWNRYAYASNSPYKNIDPDGRADINYFNRNDALYSAAERFDIPGFTTVMGHSTAHYFQDQRIDGSAGPSVGVGTLTDDIAAVHGSNQYIFLGGCSLGLGKSPELLAAWTGSKVMSATGYTIRSENENGDITYKVNSRTDAKGKAGHFKLTSPNGKSYGKISSVTMKANGEIIFVPESTQKKEKPRPEETKPKQKESN
ncbi:MAG: RHS repeat-associated core domain-containing protein [Rhodanobacteraceae bacterium]|nr:RHS repeat-associated core domain-containing protein [Rhodanobacteraceae bacterium]